MTDASDAPDASDTPVDPDIAQRIQDSFDRQRVMDTLGARLGEVHLGEVEILLPFREALTQQHGFTHAGILSAIMDTACGYAALTLAPPDAGVLAVEFKVNFLTPALGELLVARAQVVRAGRKLTVCTADAFAVVDGEDKPVATMLSTIMVVDGPGLGG